MAQDQPSAKGRVLGIGGIFFKSADQTKTREWYATHQKERVTVWHTFPSNTDYFGSGEARFMVNYIVDDLDALLDRLQKEGVKIDPKRMDESYGRFAWIYDSDGNKIELWQPKP